MRLQLVQTLALCFAAHQQACSTMQVVFQKQIHAKLATDVANTHPTLYAFG